MPLQEKHQRKSSAYAFSWSQCMAPAALQCVVDAMLMHGQGDAYSSESGYCSRDLENMNSNVVTYALSNLWQHICTYCCQQAILKHVLFYSQCVAIQASQVLPLSTEGQMWPYRSYFLCRIISVSQSCLKSRADTPNMRQAQPDLAIANALRKLLFQHLDCHAQLLQPALIYT